MKLKEFTLFLEIIRLTSENNSGPTLGDSYVIGVSNLASVFLKNKKLTNIQGVYIESKAWARWTLLGNIKKYKM